MIVFEEINTPAELHQWIKEHANGEMPGVAIADRYNHYMTIMDAALLSFMPQTYVQFVSGEIVSEDGQRFETKIITRSGDMLANHRLNFVLDDNEQILDVVYFGPDDDRVKPHPDSFH